MVKLLVSISTALALVACGGGTSGSDVVGSSGGSGFLGPASLVGEFSYYRDGSTSNPVSYLYAQDVDGDGLDEVFMIAFETQPNTAAQYSNTSVHVFGWESGVFKDITAKWLPGNTHFIEGAGDLAFGDFNGDGQTDVFLSAYTDMDHPVNAYALMNLGGSFARVNLGSESWQHGVSVGDVNGDGFDDVIVAGYANFPQYLGSANGLTPYRTMVGSSGVALGDFLGNRTQQAVFVDAGMEARDTLDTFLYAINPRPSAPGFSFDKIATLPGPVLVDSHDVRARAVDFDQDGQLDVVVFSYRYNLQSETERRSSIQFLKNMGGGQFTDVTATVLTGYDNTAGMGYVPVFRDFNGDGRLDLFVSGPDFFVSQQHKSTTLLLQQANGQFKQSYKSELSGAIASGGGQAVLAKGPQNRFYMVKESAWQRDGLTRVFIQTLQF